MDFDGDGDLDVLSGSWPGEIYLFRRQPDGEFAEGEKLEQKGGRPIQVGRASAVFAHDWDGDGDLDLLIGNISGDVHLVANEGTREEPVFASKSQKLDADGSPIKVPRGDAGPVVADWNGDGQADLLVGTGEGSVLWYRNAGTAGEPKLAAAQTLVPPPGEESRATVAEGGNPLQAFFGALFTPDKAEPADAPESDQRPERGKRAKIHVTDWNGDGRLDLLLGDFVLSREQIRRGELTEEEKAAKEKAQKRYDKVLAKLRKLNRPAKNETAEERQKRRERMSELQREYVEARKELRQYDPARTEYTYHGRVWLFLREAPLQTAADS